MPDFNWVPLNGLAINRKPKINEAIFGDGYSQRTPRGINNNPQMLDNLNFIYDEAVNDQIEAFFESKGGVSSFTWVPPGKPEGTFLCKEWSRRLISKDRSAITAKFEQVFE